MRDRLLVFAGALALTLAGPLLAQTPKSKSFTIPRTPDGHPDLQGIWTNATLTPMERPAKLAGKATLTDAEATAFEKQDNEELQIGRAHV